MKASRLKNRSFSGLTVCGRGTTADAGMTMVIVTHQLDFARDAADRVVAIDHGVILGELRDHFPPKNASWNPSSNGAGG